jgi:hypothetical protein
MLKATREALADLAKEYDGQLAAERPQIHRSMLQQSARRVMNSIANGDAATAYARLCKRTSFQPWLHKKAVKKAIDARAQVAA